MGSFFSHHKGLFIGAIVIILVFFGYGMVKKPSTPTSGSGLEKTIVDPASGGVAADDPGAAFVLQLLAIQNIKFDSGFFQDPIYRELVDQSRPLGERDVGRPNPFLDIGVDNILFPEDIVLRGNPTSSRNFVPTSATTTSATSTPATTTPARGTTPRR